MILSFWENNQWFLNVDFVIVGSEPFGITKPELRKKPSEK
jgi:hypothetical protein